MKSQILILAAALAAAAVSAPSAGEPAVIRVVNVVRAAGDGNRGVQTAAFNLPNDERGVREKGSKRVMLKNVAGCDSNSEDCQDWRTAHIGTVAYPTPQVSASDKRASQARASR